MDGYYKATCCKKPTGLSENCVKFSGVMMMRKACGVCAQKLARPLADFLRPDLTSMA
jgi:hypothetical protein